MLRIIYILKCNKWLKYFIISLPVFIYCSCNNGTELDVKNKEIELRIISMQKSIYDPYVILTSLQINNICKDTVIIERYDNVIGLINSRLGSNTSEVATILIKCNLCKEDTSVGLIDVIPPILLTDSASKMQDSFNKYLSGNDSVRQIIIDNKKYYAIPPGSNATIKIILRYSVYDSKFLQLNKENIINSSMYLVLNSKWFTKNKSHMKNMQQPIFSEEAKKIISDAFINKK